MRVASRIAKRLKTYDLRKLVNIRKVAQSSSGSENLVNTSKKLLKKIEDKLLP